MENRSALERSYDAYPDISGRPAQILGGTFRLDEVIGRGSMGTVWRATDLRTGTPVAVKLVSRLYLASPAVRSRFRREVRAVSSVRSRFAVGVIASGETRDQMPYMVMELLDGETLEDRLLRVGALPLPLAVRFAVQIARALERAHQEHVVHRDLKPANVIICERGDQLVARVIDFGVAKLVQNLASESSETSLPTATGVLVGTPEYMSPEQARGVKDVDHRSDLWAHGMLLLAMVAGRGPFDGQPFARVLPKIVDGDLPLPSELAPGLPPALDGWFRRACALDRELRFDDAWTQAETLHYAAGLPGPVRAHLDVPEPPEPMKVVRAVQGLPEEASQVAERPSLYLEAGLPDAERSMLPNAVAPRVRPPRSELRVLAPALFAIVLLAIATVVFFTFR